MAKQQQNIVHFNSLYNFKLAVRRYEIFFLNERKAKDDYVAVGVGTSLEGTKHI